ncbi:hypothetical protein CSPX01_02902 [Colletotrichum filicis]|nr:hypothetical protein CSPX01_02902 [Colletotrichum filicis]
MRQGYARITPRKSGTRCSQSSCYLITASRGRCSAADDGLCNLCDAASCLLETSIGSVLDCCIGDLGDSVLGIAKGA